MGKGHARNEDTYLDKGGTNQVTAVDAKDAVEKRHAPATQFNKTVVAEIDTLTEKTEPVINDIVLTEDSNASNAKKKVKLSKIPLAISATSVTKVRAWVFTAKNVIATEWTKVPFNVETFDVYNEFDNVTNYRFTATNAGYYKVTSNIFNTRGSGSPFPAGWHAVYKNGGIDTMYYYQFTSIYGSSIANSIVYLNAGEYIEIFLYCTVNTQIQASYANSNFTVTRI